MEKNDMELETKSQISPEYVSSLLDEVKRLKEQVSIYKNEQGKVERYITEQDLLASELIDQQKAVNKAAIVAVTNAKGIITYVNDKFCEISQYSRDELLGQNHSLLNSGTHPKSMWTEMYKTASAGEAWHQQVCNRAKDGSLYWVDTTIIGYKNEQGKVDRYIAIRADITEQKRLALELRDQKVALDETAIVAATDAKGTITYVNDKFCKISQYARDELLGENHSLLNSGAHPKSMWTEMYKTVSAGDTWHQQVCNRSKDGSLYWVDTTIIGYKNEQGKIDRYVGIRSDITIQKRLESNLLDLVDEQTKDLQAAKEFAEKAQADAEAANHAKSDFLANMSHELRTPMHSILSFAKFGAKQLAKVPLEEKGIEKLVRFLANITESGQRLMGLLNNLLDLAKLEAGKMDYEFKQQDLQLSVNRILTEFTTKLEEKSIQMRVESTSRNSIAYYDYDKIAQVLANLISNAIKFTAESSEIKVLIEDTDEGQLILSVYDQGIGIPDGELDSIFDQFIQSSKTDTGAGGTGLGLAICKEIINAHSGTIWAENNANKGAVVKFILQNNLKVKKDTHDEQNRKGININC